MQFVINGPDIPEALLQAHEEGNLVFFCGAGISYKVGLRNFKWLVDEIYRLCQTHPQPMEDEAYNRSHFDTTLDLLEARLPGQRRSFRMRKALAKALKPNLNLEGATETHSALLQLGRSRSGALRLVTTNFDRTFEKVANAEQREHNVFSAPLLPIPKDSQWDGLVYLHGVLPASTNERELDKLVVTSGDFGLAYLTERWAARFVSELFRNYVICFIGYSISDPILRYMMDALAADRLRGEPAPRAYAMAGCTSGQEEATAENWQTRGVSPVLYDLANDHAILHETLKVWAADYRDGIGGKERIVVEHAISNPSESTKQDDFVGRMLWALADKSGIPARLFADFNPVPPLTWLEAFAEDRYSHGDLYRFGVQPLVNVDVDLRFSMIRRPAPYTQAPWMTVLSHSHNDSGWDNVMSHLARWLIRHLNNPDLLIWVGQGGGPHSRLASLVESELDRVQAMRRRDKNQELDESRVHASNAILRPPMETLWRLVLTGRVKVTPRDLDLVQWKDHLNRWGLTTTVRLELRDLLSPRVTFQKPFSWSIEEETPAEPDSIRSFVDWELVLASDHVSVYLQDIADEKWKNTFPHLLSDFQQLLLDALGLLQELGEANDRNDNSLWDLPSIEPHWQNRSFRDWITLIELVRDAWLEIRSSDPARAKEIAHSWFRLPYPTFKRLALFAASKDDCIAPDEWTEWLLQDDAWWLWSIETKRETMRLLVSQGESLSPATRRKLETVVLRGPPRQMYRDDIEPERWTGIVDGSVSVLLTKLAHNETALSPAGQAHLRRQSDWISVRNNERNEFSSWMSGTGDPDHESEREVVIAPRKRHELVNWLKQPPQGGPPFYEDTWQETCRTRFFHSLFALCDLSKEGLWPVTRWRAALSVWSKDGLTCRSWRFAAPLVQQMPDDALHELVHAVAWWLEAASKSIEQHQDHLLSMCCRVMHLCPDESRNTGRHVDQAINHPIGLATQALLNLWFKDPPSDNDTLPPEIDRLFTHICDRKIEKFRHGRVILASRLIALFRVDQAWTEKHLLPLLDWSVDKNEAQAAWEGFLWSPRLYRPLRVAFKTQFLETACHYQELGSSKQQFVQFLTFSALDRVDSYTNEDFQRAFEFLPQEGLEEVARTLSRALDGASEQREDYWRNRIQPFWEDVWPKSHEFASKIMATNLALLSIAARGEFPAALSAVIDWVQPIDHPSTVVRRLDQSGLCDQFPSDSLRLLDALIEDEALLLSELRNCLDGIAKASPDLCQDDRYRRLDDHARRRES